MTNKVGASSVPQPGSTVAMQQHRSVNKAFRCHQCFAAFLCFFLLLPKERNKAQARAQQKARGEQGTCYREVASSYLLAMTRV
ncbi:MAG: hypothetical protein JNK00_11655 [Flavipsychrobacter sp.]|nr:hypothetical protein [Flavipsychrobacter sp.]